LTLIAGLGFGFGFGFGIGLGLGFGAPWRVQSMLIKALNKIAAKVLKNTWGALPQHKERFELIQEAYGESAVKADFQNWCEEVKDQHPRFPLSDYLKVVDARLGSAPVEQVVNPGVEEISALTYKLTHRPAPRKNLTELLTQFSVSEITNALTEYVGGLEDRELPYAGRTFFVDGGCAAIIVAQRKREEDRNKQIEKDQQEKNLIAALVEKQRREIELEDERREKEENAARPSVDDLFGSKQ